MKQSFFRTYSLQSMLIASFSLLIVVVAAMLIVSNYYFGKQIALKSIEQSIKGVENNVLFKVRKDVESLELLLKTYADSTVLLKTPSMEFEEAKVKMLKRILKLKVNTDQVYIAYPDGTFFKLSRVKNGYINVIVQNGAKKDIYLDEKLHVLRTTMCKQPMYDPRKRQWYQKATRSQGMVFIPPYRFSGSGEVGITYAMQMQKQGVVLAIDANLKTLDNYLRVLLTENIDDLFLFQESGEILIDAKRDGSGKVPSVFFEKKPEKVFFYKQNSKSYVAVYTELFPNNFLAVRVDLAQVLHPYKTIIWRSLVMASILLFVGIVLVILISKMLTTTLGRLVKENKKISKREFEKVELVATNIRELRSLSRSQVKMARAIARYQKQLKSLLDSIVQLIAKAIDAKSHYTAGHCERVPVLAEMLLDAIDKDQEKFADFTLGDEEEKEAFKIGAWLHDCGKVTTPEYVVDKATKLETIYNRIHEIRMRFEVLYREAYIEYLKACMEGEEQERAKERLRQKQKELQEEFAFIAECNIGGEFMDEEKKRRLEQIAKKEWIRYFDDTLGLGEIEKRRYTDSKSSLPVTERLLDDKPSHIVPRENFDYEEYKRYRFVEPVPKHLYNYGELYNLCVEKGTLTPEERFKINEHVIMTIKMLESIPFPKKMQHIPKYAGTHHEKLDCSGYPRGLCGEDLGIPERVMAIADIFEALCASDRPYKKAKTLSAALEIMSYMVKEGHIDKDIFVFFLQRGIYKRYATKFLQPRQIDEVDVESIVDFLEQ